MYSKASKMDTISSDIAEKDTKTDTKPSKPSCFDPDLDGFGPNCDKGVDCDNKNPNFTVVCPDCTKKNHPGCACTGVAANCYTGEAQWIGKGVCSAGVQLCKTGFWGGCKGEILPTPEICDGKDNDCDGDTDEGLSTDADETLAFVREMNTNAGVVIHTIGLSGAQDAYLLRSLAEQNGGSYTSR